MKRGFEQKNKRKKLMDEIADNPTNHSSSFVRLVWLHRLRLLQIRHTVGFLLWVRLA